MNRHTAIHALEPALLRRHCDDQQFSFATTDDLKPLGYALGQERALAALEFATEISRDGYNLYAIGEPGAGRFSIIHDVLQIRVTTAQFSGIMGPWPSHSSTRTG